MIYAQKLMLLIELDSEPDIGVFEHIVSFDPNNLACLDPGISAFLFRKGGCSGKIDLHDMACSNRCGYGNTQEYAGFAYIAASSVEKAICLRKPYAYRPRKVCPCVPSLLD